MTFVEIGITLFCLTGCAYTSHKAGEKRGVEIGSSVAMSLMKHFVQDKIGEEEADKIFKHGYQFEQWLQKSLGE